MKKIILLLTVVSLSAYGYYLIGKKSLSSSPLALPKGSSVLNQAKSSYQNQSDAAMPFKNVASTKQTTGNSFRQALPAKQKSLALNQDIPLNRKVELTPEELKQLEKERKRERRKNGYVKSDKPDKYAEFQKMIRTREGEKAPAYKANYKLTELYAAQQVHAARMSNAAASTLNWSERGPANVPGRTRGLLTHPDDPQHIWFAGSVAGGVWKTTDAGANWKNKTPDLPNLATTSLAMSRSNPDVIYAGTGEGFFNADAVNGDGIFKSTDGGESWKQLNSTAGKQEFRNINRIIVDPDDANVLLACSNIGFVDFNEATTNISWIMRSIDGGNSWSTVLALTSRIQQLVYSPNDFNIQYGTVEGTGVIKSTDAGKTWKLANKGMYPTGRVEIAVAPTSPSWLYASAEGNLSSGENGSDLYLSVDAGANWKLVTEADNKANINWLRGQGWYDNTIRVHPYDKNIVYVGGVQLWKMTIINGIGKTSDPVVTGIEEVNTQSFLDFVNLGGEAFDGKLVFGNLPDSAFVSVELRFGPGKAQKAHRFTVDGRGAGVPTQDYKYKDYVEVPFEVWDITNNRQLMVSFRDQQEDGKFNLLKAGVLPDSTPIERREYIFIHTTPYDSKANQNIAQNGGHQYNNMYLLWPILRDGATWEPEKLPESKLVINNEQLTTRLRITQNISDSYFEYGGKNAYVHPDHHNLVFIKVDSKAKTFKILNANDGGVYVSKPDTDPGYAQGSWIMAGNGYNTTQFYGVDKKRDANEYIGGTQDNGTWRSRSMEQASASSSYLFQIGGDGFEASWNYFNPDKIIGGSQFNGFRRSLNGGATYSSATNGLTDAGGGSPFISQIGTSRSNPDVLYTTGASGVWVSDDFGGNWKLSPVTDYWGFNGLFSDVKVSEANSQIVWAGNSLGDFGRIHVSTDGGQNFKATSGYPDATLGNISGLATHPTEDSTAYVLFSFSGTPKVLRTKDLGKTWEDISGFGKNNKSSTGFPNVAVYSLLVMPHNPNMIWVGSEIGLIESTDGGKNWALAHNGLPAVSIWELKVVDDQVVVATHGRGIWSVTIPEVEKAVVFVPYINNLRIATTGKLVVDASIRSLYDSTIVYFNEERINKLGKIPVQDTTLQFGYTKAGPITVYLKSFIKGKAYMSTSKAIEFFTAQPAYAYTNSFNASSNDFVGSGFSIQTEPDFKDGAIHSPHPYRTGTDYTYQLKSPIIIADKNATFQYKDVVIVEPGEPGAPFGSAGFYDYVIVEGTKDGVNWQRLEDGYNSDYNASWRTAYDNGLPGHDSMFVEHSVNLLTKYAPGDTVFFRFRLHSDPFAIAWGWAIDDVAIQKGYQAVAGLTLVDASTGKDVRTIMNKDTINLTDLTHELNIRANVSSENIESVVFKLNNKVYRVENGAPYALAGDNGSRYYFWIPEAGTYTLTATPYSKPNGAGTAGKPLTVTLTVIKTHKVTDLILVNANTGQDIGSIQNGGTIDLGQVGKQLNIRANTWPPSLGSVAFKLNNQITIENLAPYALAGDDRQTLQYKAWTPPVGDHTLKATPYSGSNARGTAGMAMQVKFTVVDANNPDTLTTKIVAYPNPGNGKFKLAIKAKDAPDVTVQIYNFKGSQVYQQKAALVTGNGELAVDLSTLPDGMYYLKATSEGHTFAPLQIIKQP